jgi:hypothetical protein
MRLKPKEITAITTAFKTEIGFCSFHLYLFGSRTDDHKKGGDIDLLVIVPDSNKQKVIPLKIKILNHIFDKIPEQKIDITVAGESEITNDIFLQSILPAAILLHSSF